MRELCVFCVLLVLCSGLAGTASASVTLSIDIQESPVPDLSQIRNVYHGGAPCVYAFLVVTAGGSARTDMGIAAYELGYRLVCPDASVVNQGFHRLEGWQRLGDEAELPLGESVAGSGLPAVIGYWELELKRGRKSRAEFQILPNALSDPASINLVNGEGDLIQLAWKALSEDRHCFGLINRTFYLNRPYVWTREVPRDGQIVAGFMPGAIEMPGRMGTATNIVDPALREVTERFGLISIKSLCGLSGSSDRQLRSRTGEALTLSERCDTYGLGFPVGVDLPALLDSIRALPRCEFAEPSPYGEPTICTSPEHVPNDELASESWYLERTGVECAWDWEIGNDGVRVGLIDMGVDFLLDDFGGGIGPSSKIIGGWDYDPNSDTLPDVKWGDDSDALQANHGNWMNSILGGLTNNELQVTGVAGGWGGTAGIPGPLGLPCGMGPSIVHLKIRRDFGSWITDSLYAAIRDASFKYGCDVISLSFRASQSTQLKRYVSDCYMRGTLLVSNTANIYYNEYATTFFPSCFRNDWVLCTQGSSRHPLSETDPVPERRVSMLDPLYGSPPLGRPWSAAWPDSNWPTPVLSVDVSAPASHMCVIYADSLAGETPYYRCKSVYNGVSYATPQVAGVAALMLSENPDLTVDDLQGIISASCTDIKSDYQESGVDLSGWDKYTGWGRINSDSCLVFADPLHPACYQVEHYLVEGGGAVFDSTTTKELVEFGDGAELQYEHDLEGSYLVRRFEVRRSVTPPSNYRFLWPVYRNTAGYEWSGTKGGFSDTYNTQVRYIGLVPSTQREATCDLFSYTYKVWDGTTYIGWYPAPPESLDWAYGALIQGGASGVGEHTIETGGVLRVITALPNPTAEQITVSFAVPKPGRVAVEIYDVAGRRVRALDSRRLRAGTHRLTWNGLNDAGEEVSPGMYFCRVSTVEQADVKKIVLVRGVD